MWDGRGGISRCLTESKPKYFLADSRMEAAVECSLCGLRNPFMMGPPVPRFVSTLCWICAKSCKGENMSGRRGSTFRRGAGQRSPLGSNRAGGTRHRMILSHCGTAKGRGAVVGLPRAGEVEDPGLRPEKENRCGGVSEPKVRFLRLQDVLQIVENERIPA